MKASRENFALEHPFAFPLRRVRRLGSADPAASSAPQAVGLEGVEKRIDVIATAIQFNGTVSVM